MKFGYSIIRSLSALLTVACSRNLLIFAERFGSASDLARHLRLVKLVRVQPQHWPLGKPPPGVPDLRSGFAHLVLSPSPAQGLAGDAVACVAPVGAGGGMDASCSRTRSGRRDLPASDTMASSCSARRQMTAQAQGPAGRGAGDRGLHVGPLSFLAMATLASGIVQAVSMIGLYVQSCTAVLLTLLTWSDLGLPAPPFG